MKQKSRELIDQSTEEKIKAAAYKLFTQKGYAGTKTRDIAEEAGINLALLNYYFRSKEKLFDLIMLDNIRQFMSGIVGIANDGGTTYEEKISRIVHRYIDMLTEQPDMPIFVLSEMRNDPSGLIENLQVSDVISNSQLVRQLREAMEAGEIETVNPVHIFMNILGMTIFPFVGSPVLKKLGGMTDEHFFAMMEERKTLVPKWIMEIMRKK